MIKSRAKSKTTKKTHLPLLLSLLAISLLVMSGMFLSQISRSPTRVLGEQTGSSGKSDNSGKNEQVEESEKPEEAEPTEPTETPEPQEVEDEKEAEDVQHEIENEVEQGTVEKVEVHPSSDNSNKGTLKMEQTDGATSEKAVPASQTSLISIQNPQAGTVQVSVGKNGTVTLVNNGITVQTNFPVVIDPKSQTIGIKTATGITLISTLPSQALNGLPTSDKPTIVQTAVLGEQNGQAYYDISGTQKRKFIGLIPVNANVETKINVQDGSVISSDKPWYLTYLGFLYTV